MSDCTDFCASADCTGCAEKNAEGYTALAMRLRATQSRSKRELLDSAADAIERAVADISLLVAMHQPCKICKHRFGDDPTFCLECDDITNNGNFEWRGTNE